MLACPYECVSKPLLATGACLDLFLDTGAPLSNGHTTVADMLWAQVLC